LQIDWTFPAGRIALICGAIALLSAASFATDLAIKAMLITADVAAFVLMMRSDRRAAAPLLPSGIFPIVSRIQPAGDLPPLFLQRLHGVSPLGAGYMAALASLAWTTTVARPVKNSQ
jgi:hypothetical protein